MLLDNGNRYLMSSLPTDRRQKSSLRNSLLNKGDTSGKKRGVVREKGRDLHENGGNISEKSRCHDTPDKVATSGLVKHGKVKEEIELAEMPVVNPESQAWKNTGTHDLNRPAVVIKHEVVDEGTTATPYLVPNHLTPTNLARKRGRPRKRVSNAHDLPVVNPEPQPRKNTGTHDLNQPAIVTKHKGVGERTSAPPYLVPDHPTPPNLVRKRGRPQKRVSNAHDLPVVNPEPHARKNTGTHDLNQPAVVIKHEVVGKETSATSYLVPNHPTPPNLVRKRGRPPKRVSNAHDLSAGSASKVARLGGIDSNTQKATKLNSENTIGQDLGATNALKDKIQGDIYGKCRYVLNNASENGYAATIKEPALKKTSEAREQEEKLEDSNAKLVKKRKVSKNNVEEDKFSRKDINEKKKFIGFSSSNTKFYEYSIAGVENESIVRSNDGRNKYGCSLDKIDIRRKVRDTLRLFHGVLRKLVQATEKEKQGRVDASIQLITAAKILKDHGKYINTKKIVGPVPGVEVGDIFNYRVELAIIGLHRQVQSGIDFITLDGKMIAISIVASGRYNNIMNNSDILIYSGQGGNVDSGCKQLEDQKLERGNLALKNSIDSKNKVRVIRGFKERKQINWKRTTTPTYIYDGLYTVERYWTELGPNGKSSFKFELKRVPHQPELTWKKVQLSKNTRAREGRHVDDISNGKEKNPICAVNTIDDEKSPSFIYITKVMYPDWCRPLPPEGCGCKDGCSDSKLCACARKNGGEMPYTYSGTLVEEKSLVYECGPSCKCPPTCHNRVSQNGIKLPFEIFKTESKGWGLRCLSSIPIGSFVCEYVGELLDDNEAEQRIDQDGYLFDIGENYNDSTLRDGLSSLIPDMTSKASDMVDSVGFTLDARVYANVGRFINHSCSPNLLAQNVLYDSEDKRIPHIMFFAAENIPPLQELTYHYNYIIGQVVDSKGNVKEKSCYCGSIDCSGRMY